MHRGSSLVLFLSSPYNPMESTQSVRNSLEAKPGTKLIQIPLSILLPPFVMAAGLREQGGRDSGSLGQVFLVFLKLPLQADLDQSSFHRRTLRPSLSFCLNHIQKGGTWMAQLAKHPTLDLSSGLDLRGQEFRPALGSTLGMEPV